MIDGRIPSWTLFAYSCTNVAPQIFIKKGSATIHPILGGTKYNSSLDLECLTMFILYSSTYHVFRAWKHEQSPQIHGWVYGLNSGYVTDLGVNMSSNEELDEVYQLKFSN